MGKTAPIVLSFVVLFCCRIFGMDSKTDEVTENYFTCDNGEEISLNLQNDGFDDCSDGSDD